MVPDPEERPKEPPADASLPDAPEERVAAGREPAPPPEPPRARTYPPRPKR